MAEYIDREALLGIFDATISHMRDRVGADGLLLASIGLVQNSRDLVAEFPAADVVGVVRCKDCVYASRDGYICRYGVGRVTSPDDYCKNGEKNGRKG